MEKNKKDYLQAAIYTFLKFEIANKYKPHDSGISEFHVFINPKIDEITERANVDLKTALKNFRSISYSSNEVAGISGKILKEIKSETGIHVKNDEVFDYLKDTLLNAKKLIKKLRNKFKNISRFL